MGFNLKEKLQKLSKKQIIISIIVLVALITCAVAGFEYYQFSKLKTEAERQAAEEVMPIDLGVQPKKPSEYQIGIEYKQALKGKKPIVALFYADWCHYCVKFMPIYQTLSEKYGEDFNFSKVNVEDKKYEKIVNEVGITGFPTVYIIDPKYDNKVLISNAVLGNIENVSKELDRFARIRKMLDKK